MYLFAGIIIPVSIYARFNHRLFGVCNAQRRRPREMDNGSSF